MPTLSAKAKKKEVVEILKSRVLYGFDEPCIDSNNQNIVCHFEAFAGDVKMRRGKTLLFADSVVINKTKKAFYAYDNVHIRDLKEDTTDIYSQYLYYDGKARKMLLQRDVRVYQPKQQLFCEELLYDRNKKTVDYYTGGHIILDSMHVYSRAATYYMDSAYALLRHKVRAKDSAFRLRSDSIRYYRDTRVLRFIAPTRFIQDSAIMLTTRGYYQMETGDVHLEKHALILHKASIYTADTIDYNKNTGKGRAHKNFSYYDTAKRVSLNSQRAIFNSRTKYFRTMEKPFLIYTTKEKNKKTDTIYMSADTIITHTTNFKTLDSIRIAKEEAAKKITDSLAKIEAQTNEQAHKQKRRRGRARDTSRMKEDSTRGKLKIKDSTIKNDTLNNNDTLQIKNDSADNKIKIKDSTIKNDSLNNNDTLKIKNDKTDNKLKNDKIKIKDSTKNDDTLQIKNDSADNKLKNDKIKIKDSTKNDDTLQIKNDSVDNKIKIKDSTIKNDSLNNNDTLKIKNDSTDNKLKNNKTKNEDREKTKKSVPTKNSSKRKKNNTKNRPRDSTPHQPIPNQNDSTKNIKPNDSTQLQTISDSTQLSDSTADSTVRKPIDSLAELREIFAYNHVKIYKDSMQSVADSFAYSGLDSTLRTFGDPILWREDVSQFVADTINYLIEHRTIKYMDGRQNTFTIQRHKEKGMFDQIKSNNLRVFIDSGKLSRSLSMDSVRSIVYMPEEKDPDKMKMVNVVSSDSLWAYYKNSKPERVVYLRNIVGTTYPISLLPADKKFLPDFKWLADSSLRPHSRYDIVSYRNLHHHYILSMDDYERVHKDSVWDNSAWIEARMRVMRERFMHDSIHGDTIDDRRMKKTDTLMEVENEGGQNLENNVSQWANKKVEDIKKQDLKNSISDLLGGRNEKDSTHNVLNDSVIKENLLNDSVLKNVLNDSVIKEKLLNDSLIKNNLLNDSVIKNNLLNDSVLKEKLLNDSLVKNNLLNDSLIKNKLLNDSLVKNNLLNDSLIKNKLLNDSLIKNKLLNDSLVKNNLLNDSLIKNNLLNDSLIKNNLLNDSVIKNNLLNDSVIKNNLLNDSLVKNKVSDIAPDALDFINKHGIENNPKAVSSTPIIVLPTQKEIQTMEQQKETLTIEPSKKITAPVQKTITLMQKLAPTQTTTPVGIFPQIDAKKNTMDSLPKATPADTTLKKTDSILQKDTTPTSAVDSSQIGYEKTNR